MSKRETLAEITAEVVECRRCPRLVAWREEVAANPRSSYRGEVYWGRPIPGFGDPAARVVVVGLAPAAHGGNRTGRVFTGDRSGDWLFRAMHRAGLANQPHSISADDGLTLTGAWVTAAVRCAPPANKADHHRARHLRRVPGAGAGGTGAGGDRGARFVRLRGGLADAAGPGNGPAPSPDPDSVTASTSPTGGPVVVCSFHPSQQNTFTGKLTEEMLDRIFTRARDLAGLPFR